LQTSALPLGYGAGLYRAWTYLFEGCWRTLDCAATVPLNRLAFGVSWGAGFGMILSHPNDHDNRSFSSSSARRDGALVFSRRGVKWKECERPAAPTVWGRRVGPRRSLLLPAWERCPSPSPISCRFGRRRGTRARATWGGWAHSEARRDSTCLSRRSNLLPRATAGDTGGRRPAHQECLVWPTLHQTGPSPSRAGCAEPSPCRGSRQLRSGTMPPNLWLSAPGSKQRYPSTPSAPGRGSVPRSQLFSWRGPYDCGMCWSRNSVWLSSRNARP